MYGADTINNQTVVTYVATRWSQNPFTRGTWSLGSVGESYSEGPFLSLDLFNVTIRHLNSIKHTSLVFYLKINTTLLPRAYV